MKIINTLLCLCFASSIAFSQISIGTGDMPNSGDTLRFSVGDLDTATLSLYTQTGTNFMWDFTHLTPNSQGLNNYVPASSTSYAFFFLGANKFGLELADTLNLGGQLLLTNIYDFYKNSSTKYEAEGRGITFQGFPLPSFYSDNDEIYQFPLDFGDQDSSTFDFTTALPFIGTLTTKGYRLNDVDGWGTIVTPYDSLPCVRVVTDIVSEDSINITGIGGFAFPNHVREYKWLAKGQKFPMLEITGNVVLGAFVPTEVRYRDIFRNLDEVVSPFAPNADFVANNLTPEATIDTVTFTPQTLAPIGNNYTWGFTPNTVTYVNGTNSASENPEVLFNAPGLYDVYMYISNPFGNADTTKLNYINVATVSTNQISEAFQLKVFPNPITEGQMSVAFQLTEPSEVVLTLMNIQGQTVRTFKNAKLNSGAYQEQFSVEGLSGVYLLNVQMGKSQATYRLLIK